MIFLGRGLKNHCVPNDFLIPVPEKSSLKTEDYFYFFGIDTLMPWADLVTRERLAPALFFFLG